LEKKRKKRPQAVSRKRAERFSRDQEGPKSGSRKRGFSRFILKKRETRWLAKRGEKKVMSKRTGAAP